MRIKYAPLTSLVAVLFLCLAFLYAHLQGKTNTQDLIIVIGMSCFGIGVAIYDSIRRDMPYLFYPTPKKETSIAQHNPRHLPDRRSDHLHQ